MANKVLLEARWWRKRLDAWLKAAGYKQPLLRIEDARLAELEKKVSGVNRA